MAVVRWALVEWVVWGAWMANCDSSDLVSDSAHTCLCREKAPHLPVPYWNTSVERVAVSVGMGTAEAAAGLTEAQ